MSPGRPARDDELLGRTRAERADDRVVRPFQLFARRQASGGLVLLGCAILALAWTNSPWTGAYRQMLGVLEGGVAMAVLTLLTLDLFLPGGPVGRVCGDGRRGAAVQPRANAVATPLDSAGTCAARVGPGRIAPTSCVRPRTDRLAGVPQCQTLAAAPTLAMGTGLVHAQGGRTMNGGGWHGGWMGGYGGMWIPILLVVVVGLLAWIVMQRRK